MADVSDNVVSNNVNNSNAESAVENAEVACENKTDKVMGPILLEEYVDNGKPQSLVNLLTFLERHHPGFSCFDLMVGLIYIIFLESGFVTEEESNNFDSWDFDYQRVKYLSQRLPITWKNDQNYIFDLILPSFPSNKVRVVCYPMGDESILNCVVSDIKDAACTLCLDPLYYFTKYSNPYKENTLQHLKNLSLDVKKQICHPIKQRIFKENSIVSQCIEMLPPEMIIKLMSYLNIKDMVNLGCTNSHFNSIMKTPKLWLMKYVNDFKRQPETLTTYEDFRNAYMRIHELRKVVQNRPRVRFLLNIS